jgi:hypothetical protein
VEQNKGIPMLIQLRPVLSILMAAAAIVLAVDLRVEGVSELIPPLARIKADHPRVLLRPQAGPFAISTGELRAEPHDAAYRQMLTQLRAEKSVMAQAMVWRLTDEPAAAERAIATMRAYRYPGEVDTFHVYFTLTEYALAYDWLYGYTNFSSDMKAEVRANLQPLAERGLKYADDHMFHNYIWMSAGGVALWALATAHEDTRADQLFERARQRFNTGLFPAWKYLDGLPSEPMGYWSLYVLSPGVLTLLGAQSAFETDLIGTIHQSDGDWLERHFENLIQSTLPDMRYVPWGDLQSGPNGGITHDMAGIIDALTWATKSAHGAYFGQWLAAKRGLSRFRAETAVYYFLYARHLSVAPAVPSSSFLAGRSTSGHFLARSDWTDDATIVTLRATDHFGDHHHYDQGSFIIYRHGLLAVDPPVYRQVRGPQQPTEVHNTLLLGGQGQRPARGQWFRTVEEFQKNLTAGRQLETGDLLFAKDSGNWAAAAAQFAQAYSPTQVQSCVRQILFVRPNRIVVVDQLTAPANQSLPEVQWLLQLPKAPITDAAGFWATNGKSWIRCQALLPEQTTPTVEATAVNTQRASWHYRGGSSMQLVHFIDVGDGSPSATKIEAKAADSAQGIEVQIDRQKFRFAAEPPFAVTSAESE